MLLVIPYKMKSWRGIYFGDLKKSAKFNSANYFLMPNVHGVRWCETRGEIQQ